MRLSNPKLTVTIEPRQIALGPLMLQWDGERMMISRGSTPTRVLWSSSPGEGFIRAARGRAEVHESRGFFTVKDGPVRWTQVQTLDRMETTEDGVELSGLLDSSGGARWIWRFRLRSERELEFDLEVIPTDGAANVDRILLTGSRGAQEAFFGFGEQLTHLNLAGKRIPVLSQEPGIGRGVQPLTWMMNLLAGAGGTDVTSGAPAPQFITSALRGFALTTTAYAVFDLREPDRIALELHQGVMHGRLFTGDTPLELVETYTQTSGRMPEPPAWLDRGAIIGMQGGTQAVERMAERLARHRAPVSAYWLQDWVGARRTSIGEQLWWNWEVDPERYPGWDELVTGLEREGVKVLTYLNPFLVDPREKGTFKRNLYQEALEAGYLVRDASGDPLSILNTSFSAALVDLTNPEARTWLKEVIKTELLASGASGWMADFGEALPFDAQLHDGQDAALYHNQYPVDWARLNREAIREAGREGEVLFFTRSGYTTSPGESTLFWMGDQLTAWDREDGIKSALVGLLSSGYAGMSLNHGDIGGYTATTLPRSRFQLPWVSYWRGKELLMRWMELCAFTAVFRTHDGNQPDRNVQIDEDDETLSQFARFARLYAALAPYRRGLFREAAERGLPVVRHLWLHHPDDSVARDTWDQLLLGPDLLLAPVLDPGLVRREVYLPEGSWTHLWTGALYEDADEGQRVEIEAPMGEPPAFFRTESAHAALFLEAASQAGA